MKSASKAESVAQTLRERVREGRYLEMGRLPSERDLVREFGVHRKTIHAALERLIDEGLLVQETKRGTFLRKEGLPSRIVGRKVLLVNTRNPHSTSVSQVIEGMRPALEDAGLGFAWQDSAPARGRITPRLPTLEDIQSHDAAAVVLWPPSMADPGRLREWQRELPLLLIDRRVLGMHADVVRFDDVEGGRLATRHFLDRGHRKVAFVGDEAHVDTVYHRWMGYIRAHEEVGIGVGFVQTATFYGLSEPLFSATMRALLKRDDDPITAVVCSNDITATQLVGFLRQEGLRVPEDVAVTGYGDIVPTYMTALGLSTIAQPFEALGRTAAEVILKRLAPGGLGHPPFDVALPVRLVVRQTCGG